MSPNVLPNDDARHDVARDQQIDTASAAPATGRLEALEATIDRGLRTFVEVGEALLEIRDQRLYRTHGFTGFEEYCRVRWGWTHRHVNRQIAAAEVVKNLGPIGPTVQNEAQARELTRLSPEEQREVAATIDFENTTAEEIRAKVAKLTDDEETPIEAPVVVYQAELTDDADRTTDIPAAATASESDTLRAFALNLRAGLNERSNALKKLVHDPYWDDDSPQCTEEYENLLREALHWVDAELDKVLGTAKRRKKKPLFAPG